MRIHVVVSSYLGDMHKQLTAQMTELFSKHGMNAQEAAEDIWKNKDRYSGLSSERLPLSNFKNEMQDGRYPEVEDTVRETLIKAPNDPPNKIWYEVVNKNLIASEYLRLAREWSRGQSPLQQSTVSPTKLPYAITHVQTPGTPDEITRDVSEHLKGRKFASALIQAVVRRYLTSSTQEVQGAYVGQLLEANALRSFHEIQDEYAAQGKHHCLRLKCGVCGNVQTCRCRTPKDDVTGICDRCEKSRE